MENNGLNRMLCSLDDEIDKKCFELRQRRTEKFLQRLFIIICAFLVIVPCTLVFAGVNLWTLCVPVILFFIVSLGALSPLLLNKSFGGRNHGKF